MIRCYKLHLIGLVFLTLPVVSFAGPKNVTSKKHYHATTKSVANGHSKSVHTTRHHELTPVAMPAERASQIQAALIKQGYLTGEPTGSWDAQTVSAMQHLQGDNGWQTKVAPDSRAIIKLGLGPHPVGDNMDHPQNIAQTTPH